MKKHLIYLTALTFLTFISCGDDDSSPSNPLVSVEPDPIEDTVLNPTSVSDNLIFQNASKIEGDAPSPSGNLDFTLTKTTQKAFLENGFTVAFNTQDDYTGAYIQLFEKDGAKADNYWDIQGGFWKNSIAKNTFKNKNLFLVKNLKQEYPEELTVNFNTNITPGKFCYWICLYDDEGNISEPQEVCVEIEAWGGNPNLVGTWNVTKQIFDGETILPGEVNFCEGPDYVTCDNGEELIIPEEEAWCYSSTKIELEFKEDGTFIIKDENTHVQDFDEIASEESCQIVNEQLTDGQKFIETTSGKWAYDEENQTLSLIEFQFSEVDADTGEPIQGEEYENGYVFFDNVSVELNSNELILSFNEDFIDTQIFFNK